MLTVVAARCRRFAVGVAIAAAAVLTVLTPKAAQAWWGPGWRGGIVVGLPPVVVGPPVYPAAPYPYYSYTPAYAVPYWHWVPEYRAANGTVVAGHWEH